MLAKFALSSLLIGFATASNAAIIDTHIPSSTKSASQPIIKKFTHSYDDTYSLRYRIGLENNIGSSSSATGFNNSSKEYPSNPPVALTTSKEGATSTTPNELVVTHNTTSKEAASIPNASLYGSETTPSTVPKGLESTPITTAKSLNSALAATSKVLETTKPKSIHSTPLHTEESPKNALIALLQSLIGFDCCGHTYEGINTATMDHPAETLVKITSEVGSGEMVNTTAAEPPAETIMKITSEAGSGGAVTTTIAAVSEVQERHKSPSNPVSSGGAINKEKTYAFLTTVAITGVACLIMAL